MLQVQQLINTRHNLPPLGPHNLPSEPQLCGKSSYRGERGREKKKERNYLCFQPQLSLFQRHFQTLLAGNLLELHGRLLSKS